MSFINFFIYILGIGYNGFPRGCNDDLLPWSSKFTKSTTTSTSTSSQEELHHKEWFMVHAEVNAILNKIGNIYGTTMYVYGSFPCNECAKIIIQAGIKEIVYIDNNNSNVNIINDNDNNFCNGDNCESLHHNRHNHNDIYDYNNQIRASRILFGLAGVKVTRFIDDYEEKLIEKIPDLKFTNNESNESKVVVDEEVTSDSSDATTSNNIQQNEKSDTLSIITDTHRNLLIKEANYDPFIKKDHDTKRSNYLSWDDYFMSVASLSAYRSKDPNTQVGACIVDANKCIIGIGYNGFPRGCSDDYLPWSRKAHNPLHTKYPYVVHAEVNAILNKGSKDCTGASIYVDLFPCNDCAKVIIQSGIKEVVYLSDTYHDTDGCRASRILFEMAGVKYRQYFPIVESVNVDIFDR